MGFPWIREVICNLVNSIHDVASCGLSEVFQLAHGGMMVEVRVVIRCIFESMVELHEDLCRDWFHLSIGQLDISNDVFIQSTLRKFIGSILHLLDVDFHIISWMFLIFDVEADVLIFPDGFFELFIILA